MRQLYLYLFIFSLLINVFQYVNDSKILEGKDKEIEKAKTLNDSLKIYKNMFKEASYFSIDENKNAQKKFGDYSYEDVMKKVLLDLTTLNTQEGGNPLLPTATDGSKTLIRKASVLNHQWIILDYSNDSEVGEMLIEYTFDPNEFTTFKVIENTTY